MEVHYDSKTDHRSTDHVDRIRNLYGDPRSWKRSCWRNFLLPHGYAGVRSTAQYLRLTAEVYPDLMKQVEKNCSYVIPEVVYEGN